MNLLDFCDSTDPRSYIQKPFYANGYLYATNGHIAVRVDNNPEIESITAPSNLAETINKYINSAQMDSLIDVCTLQIPLLEKCQCQTQQQEKEVDCEDCDGKGYFYYGENNHIYQCQECCSTGKILVKIYLCPYCDDTGYKKDSVQVGHSLINDRYMRMITQLSQSKITTIPDKNKTTHNGCKAHVFTFVGGSGVVMSMGV